MERVWGCWDSGAALTYLRNGLTLTLALTYLQNGLDVKIDDVLTVFMKALTPRLKSYK